jgi:hypothetical protein
MKGTTISDKERGEQEKGVCECHHESGGVEDGLSTWWLPIWLFRNEHGRSHEGNSPVAMRMYSVDRGESRV